MHFTGTVYRNPYWPTFPLLQITQGCTHNSCKFCTMYRDVKFKMQPLEWVEEDLRELAEIAPDATTIQLLSANPLPAELLTRLAGWCYEQYRKQGANGTLLLCAARADRVERGKQDLRRGGYRADGARKQ